MSQSKPWMVGSILSSEAPEIVQTILFMVQAARQATDPR